VLSAPGFRFYHPIEVRYGDLDPQAHVNNARYFTYMEQARIAYIRELGLWDGKSFLDVGIILADARVTFLAPIYFGEELHVGARVTEMGNKSLTMEYSLEEVEGDKQFATGSSVLVAYDYREGRAMPIPEHWRKTILAYENPS
jgi:acyl-CoA thioester hydrolase